MFKFPARFEADPNDGYTVTFRDIPEATTQGASLDEAKAAAVDALVTAMDFYFEDGRQVPAPSKAQAGEIGVSLPPSIAAKVLLLNRCLEANKRPIDLARAMGIKSQEVTRILDLHHATKIDTLAAAFGALGYELELKVSAQRT